MRQRCGAVLRDDADNAVVTEMTVVSAAFKREGYSYEVNSLNNRC